MTTRLVMLTSGIYSYFTIDGFYMVPDNINLEAERDSYHDKFLEDYQNNKRPPDFKDWLVAEGKATPIKYEEFHVSSYGVHYDRSRNL